MLMTSRFINLLVTFIIIAVVAVNANEEEEVNIVSADRLDSLLKRAAKVANLKDVEADQSLAVQTDLLHETEESRFLQGYFFFATYFGSGCNDADLESLEIIKLNQCNIQNDYLASRKFRAWVTVRGNLGLTWNNWSGYECKDDWKKADEYFPINQCFGKYKVWTGPLPATPPAIVANTVGFYLFSNNLKCLDSKDFWKDFDLAYFFRQQHCLEYDPDDPDRDTYITGCDHMGVHLQRYYSKDGTCTTGSYDRTYNRDNVCLWYNFFGERGFSWTRYQCY